MGYSYNECADCHNKLSIERAVLHCGSCEKPTESETPKEWEPMSEAERNNERRGEYIQLDAVKEILRDELEAVVSAVVEGHDTSEYTAHDAMRTLSDVFRYYSGVMRRMKERDGG